MQVMWGQRQKAAVRNEQKYLVYSDHTIEFSVFTGPFFSCLKENCQ